MVENFYNDEFIFGIQPLMLRIAPEETHRFLSIRTAAGGAEDGFARFQTAWAVLTPELPFNAFFQDTVFDGYFAGINSSAKIFLFIAFAALLISIMGLFGLVLATVARRNVEIGIRKSLGATTAQIIGAMQRETVIVTSVALVVAAPLGFVAIRALLDGIGTSANRGAGSGDVFILELAYFIVPVLVICAAAFVTSFAGAWRGATRPTVDILRDRVE